MKEDTQKEPGKQAETAPLAGPSQRLSRLTLMVTDEERESLRRIVADCGGRSVRRMLESFVADLCDSARRSWPWGRAGAAEWLRTHQAGLDMDRRSREGGGQ